MVSAIKTLIFFDTNALRNVVEVKKRNGKTEEVVAYNSFKFGSYFEEIESFINKKGIFKFIEFAIPKMVFEELLKQKIRSYSSDVKVFSKIFELLTDLPYPNKAENRMFDITFNYKAHIEGEARQYLSKKNVKLIEIPEDETQKEIFQSIIRKAVNTTNPFKRHGKRSDVGFKDTLIWESILNYRPITNFEKIIFFTNDECFNEDCEKEFKNRFKKNILVRNTASDVKADLSKSYWYYIQNYDLIKFSESPYFKSKLDEKILGGSLVMGSKTYRIVRFDLLDPCLTIEKVEDSEQNYDTEVTLINSKMRVFYLKKGKQLEKIVIVKTLLDETKGFIDAYIDEESL